MAHLESRDWNVVSFLSREKTILTKIKCNIYLLNRESFFVFFCSVVVSSAGYGAELFSLPVKQRKRWNWFFTFVVNVSVLRVIWDQLQTVIRFSRDLHIQVYVGRDEKSIKESVSPPSRFSFWHSWMVDRFFDIEIDSRDLFLDFTKWKVNQNFFGSLHCKFCKTSK